MAATICDICGVRPATRRVPVVQNGERRTLAVCDNDYARLVRQQRQASPFESLFRGTGFDDIFGDDPFAAFGRGGRSGRRRGPERTSVDISDYFSDQTRELLQQAAQRAVDFGKGEVDTEHLLDALMDSEVVQAILRQVKISPEEVRNQIESDADRGTFAPSGDGPVEVSVSPRVKGALENAFNASRELGHSYVGPEHLLVGLAEEQDGLAGDLLRKYGLTPNALRQQTVKVVGQGAEEGRVAAQTTTPQLDKYSRDLTALARQGKLDPVIGRWQEIETTIEILARRKKNNPVLIGEPGVGKTAIVEGLAQAIANGEVPEVLRDKRLVELNVNSLVAGSKYRGEFEERIKQVLDEIVAHQSEVIVFIDELHTIVGAGQGGEGGLDAANVFKPALARGELNLIGATTLNEYQRHIEKDAALERRFQPVFVDEPTVEQTIMILRGLRDRLEAHHKVTVSDEALVAAAEYADRYVTNRFLPDKAIDLIDQAAARVRIGTTSRPAALHELESEIKQLRREEDFATSRKQFERAKDFSARIADKDAQLSEGTEHWRKRVGSGSVEVRPEHVAEIVSTLTGIPVSELTKEERQKLVNMEQLLHRRVIGQDEAIQAVSAAVRLARSGLKDERRPIATFFFLGPTGVGKTELAKAVAETVFGDEDALVRLDMSEYMERHAVARLIGAPPGYVGYEEGGQLTERVRRRPYSVILLDEIEKAHPDVHNILLQIFDDGRLTDGKGRVVDFTNTILIATSNVGAEIIQRELTAPEGSKRTYDQLKSELMTILRRHFRPEFLNRIDDIIVFRALDRDQIKEIVDLQLARVRRTAAGQGVTLEFDPSVVEHLAEIGYQPEFGARELRRQIRTLIETKLAAELLGDRVHDGDRLVVRYDEATDRVVFDKQSAQDSATEAIAGTPEPTAIAEAPPPGADYAEAPADR
jgi:ATP-dependent Clp protease ATP-binding subunit ClpC